MIIRACVREGVDGAVHLRETRSRTSGCSQRDHLLQRRKGEEGKETHLSGEKNENRELKVKEK